MSFKSIIKNMLHSFRDEKKQDCVAEKNEEIKKIDLSSLRSFSTIVIPEGVTEIEDNTFDFCGVTLVTIPGSVTRIGESAFSFCSDLKSVTIQTGVREIGDRAFSGCTKLTSVIIPGSVTRIGRSAFSFCRDMKSVTIPDSVTKIESGVFSGCPEITVICGEGSYAHRYCKENNFTFLFDYQFEAFRGVLPPGIEKLASPFLSDEEKPYVFISYSHKDRDAVLEVIKTLYESGWRIWYDEGLTIGDRYDETLEEHVKNCSAFLLFVTEHSARSNYIREHEIPWAQACGKPIVKCILDERAYCKVDPDSVVAVVSSSEIEPALEKIEGLTKTGKREAKGISVVVNPADRDDGANGDGFAYCLYANTSAAKAKAILLEAKNGGCNLYDAVENGEDRAKLQNSASLIVFINKAFLSDTYLTGILSDAFGVGRDIAVCQLEDIEDGDLPENLKALYKMQWLSFVHGITKDMNTRLARHLQKRGCRNTAVFPGFEYETTDEGIVITRYSGMELEPKIEREYGGVPVVKIADNAFENRIHLKRVVIPDTVTEIGMKAFNGCTSLISVLIPDGVTHIGSFAFWNCISLSSVSIPYGIKKIEPRTFSNCTSLVSVSIPDSVTEIGDSVFSGCEKLTSVKIPESVTRIGDAAFKGCQGLADSTGYVIIKDVLYSYYGTETAINIPNGVTEISERAFFMQSDYSRYRLEAVVIPDSVKKIGEGAFESCSDLTSVKIPDCVTIIGDEAFRGCRGLADNNGFVIIKGVLYSYIGEKTSVNIPKTVKRIAGSAFKYNKKLTSVMIPNSVTGIGNSAFSNCVNLQTVIIPYSVTELGESAFEYCEGLSLVTISDNMTKIEKHTFKNCRNLKEVIVPDSVTSIDDEAFSGCDGLVDDSGFLIVRDVLFSYFGKETAITIPRSVKIIANAAFEYSKELTSVRIPNSVTEIGKYAFSHCKSLKSVVVPYSVTSIGDNAFYNCPGLADRNGFVIVRNALYSYFGKETAITIPRTVKRIAGSAFYNNKSLVSVMIPNTVTEIGKYAFCGCASLSLVTVPESVTEIGKNAFERCKALSEITIPESVTEIGESAFSKCENLTICGAPGSYAEAYAKELQIPFKEV